MTFRFAYGAIGWQLSMTEVARLVGSIGFSGLEGFGMLDLLPSDLSLDQSLESLSLSFVGSYFSGSFVEKSRQPQELDDFERTCKQIAQWNGELVTVGGGRILPNEEGNSWSVFLETVDAMHAIAKKYGVRFCFHPHIGTLICSGPELERFVGSTSNEVTLCLDTAHMAASRMDVTESITRYKRRLGHIHLKDCKLTKSVDDFEFVPLGEGSIDFSQVFRTLNSIEYKGWITIELDSWLDPLEAAKKSFSFVKQYR